jgi:hypothetical protein
LLADDAGVVGLLGGQDRGSVIELLAIAHHR